MLIIRCVEYIDPVTQGTRYGVDYWSVRRYWASDHATRVLAELSYETVHWLPTFWDAVMTAQQEDKPILLWAMNGHPLACT